MADHVGNLGRQLQLIGTWDGKMLEQGYQVTAGKITKAAGTMATKTSGLVNDKMGRSMSMFNEKTEKGRQLLTTFGGAVGGAAGNVVYYAGTLSYVVGRFSVWELGIMGVLAAIGGLAWALSGLTEEEKKAAKALEEFNKELTDAKKKSKELYEQEKLRMSGAEGARQIEERNIQERVKAKETERKIWEESLEEYKRTNDDMTSSEMIRLIKQRDSLRRQEKQLKDHYKELRGQGKAYFDWQLKQQELENREAAATAAAKAGKKGGKGKKDAYEDLTGAPGIYGLAPDAIKRAIAFQAQVIEAETEYQSIRLLKDLQDKETNEKQAILDAELDWERRRSKAILAIRKQEKEDQLALDRETEDAKNSIMMDGIDIFEEIGSLMASSEEANTAVKVAAIMARAGWRMYEEIAEGVATSVTQPWVAASHFAAAGLFAALAAGDVAAAMSGGGGGGGASSSNRAALQGEREPLDTTEERQTTIVVNLGGKEVGRAIFDAYEGHKDDLNPNRGRKVVGY